MKAIAADSWLVTFAFTQNPIFSRRAKAYGKRCLLNLRKAHGQAIWVRDMATALAQDESVMRNFMYKAGKLGYLTPIVKDRFFPD